MSLLSTFRGIYGENVTTENVKPATGLTVLRQELREAGLRATGARISVLRVLREAARPMSHAEVADALTGEPWDKATVYRNLVDLAGVGLLRRVVLGGRVWRFEDADQTEHDNLSHAHFVCVKCGTVECLPEDAVSVGNTASLPSAGRVEVQLRGECLDCS